MSSPRDAASASAPSGAATENRQAQTVLRVAVGIASAGRPGVLEQTVGHLIDILPRDTPIFVCVPDMQDAGHLAQASQVSLLVGRRGLTHQRNAILQAAVGRSDLLVFFDDDFIPDALYLQTMSQAFNDHPDIVIATGNVLADGILDLPLTMDDAAAALAQPHRASGEITPVYNAYGCNMALRLQPVERNALQFDESLPLYAWLEDVDFSRAIASHGRSVKVMDAVGVHLGVRSGRQPGLRLGYSQIANPVYLSRKGTMATGRATAQIARNILANIRGVALFDRAIDRRGRLQGNVLGLIELVLGRLSPLRVLKFSPRGASTPSEMSRTTP
ncbi:glycosyltransferase family 2 protein [Rhizobium halophytocola]|uniref:Glycosyltransferase n=1 Tax=Rhizobium halophytocola TaxID=735519 RepID=A0ABS4E5K6_9HYPH|nr:glycosyltransferase [Rhizobium halophytocola]MBP1853191.1 hypothetical protein [Rhizobium halophytocola]